MTKILCDVYKSPKKEGAYLYVNRKEQFERVPELLLETFGKPELALILVLTEDKVLARVDAKQLIEALKDPGFYLQMPPVEDLPLLDLFYKMDKE